MFCQKSFTNPCKIRKPGTGGLIHQRKTLNVSYSCQQLRGLFCPVIEGTIFCTFSSLNLISGVFRCCYNAKGYFFLLFSTKSRSNFLAWHNYLERVGVTFSSNKKSTFLLSLKKKINKHYCWPQFVLLTFSLISVKQSQ